MSQVLSQTQIIRSLGQALEWFEKEISWGVSPAELKHLTGRIGELYVAMVTRGQMALLTNQKGYDVVSLEGEYISVKTITSSNHVKFNAATFDVVQRVMILRLVVEEDTVSIEEILDCPAAKIRNRGLTNDGSYKISMSGLISNGFVDSSRQLLTTERLRKLKETGSATFGSRRIVQYENGTVIVEIGGQVQKVTLPILLEIAKQVNIPTLNSAGNKKNTRTLGADIIKALS